MDKNETEEDFYKVVSSIARFIDETDKNEEKNFNENKQ